MSDYPKIVGQVEIEQQARIAALEAAIRADLAQAERNCRQNPRWDYCAEPPGVCRGCPLQALEHSRAALGETGGNDDG